MTGPTLNVQPLDTSTSFRTQVYHALKQAITEMDIYDHKTEIRLDERQVSEKLGVSRTPIREAMTLLEQEGFVRSQPRRGIFVIRKTKREILEMVTVWAALESMAARIITETAADKDIAKLRKMFSEFEGDDVRAHIDEYSDANIRFHEAIISLSGNQLIADIIEGLFMHVRAIRARTIHEADRVTRSIVDHMHIIEALEARNTDLAAKLVREHTLNLRVHVEESVALE